MCSNCRALCPKRWVSRARLGTSASTSHFDCKQPDLNLDSMRLTINHSYRPDFAPLPDPPVPPQHPTYVGTPLCRCGKPCVLRPDARGKSRARLVEQGVLETSDQYDPALDMLYYWQCSAGAQNEGKGCSKWSPMDFKAEGRGQYFISQVPESLL